MILTKQKHFLNKTKTLELYDEQVRCEESKAQMYNFFDKEIESMSKFVETNEKIAEAVVEGYKKIEDSIVGGYKKIEKGAVDGFAKVTDKCVEKMFAKECETVEEAKKRLVGAIIGFGIGIVGAAVMWILFTNYHILNSLFGA